ncbi:MAG: hypothetical protein L6Q69_20660 [Zoogloea sp.]|nr:hypothetical protein [Zoogloea sp.]
MNHTLDTNPTESLAPVARMPERFLIVGPDEAWCEATRATLARHAAEQTAPSFLSWRLQHGLMPVLPFSGLNDALTQALTAPTSQGVRRNVLRLWTAQTESEWYAFASRCQALATPAASGVKLKLLGANATLRGVEQAAGRPDALARLSWLMEERPTPVPRNWLSLGPIPELSEAQNAAMAEEGYRCYSAWAAGVLASYEPEELQELWGPFPDDEDAEQDGNDAENKVVPFQRPFTEQPRPQNRPVAEGRGFRTGGASFSDGRLAAASASGSGGSTAPEPAHTWRLESAFSHGAYSLQAWVRPPKSAGDKSAIEFVALWDDERATPAKPGDIRLVLTLPRRKPVLLTGRPDAQPATGSLYSLRFDWPREAWPEDLGEAPPLHLKRKLKAVLEKARVSLM